MTAGALEGIYEANLSVPDEIAVVGYDEISWATLLRTALTTVSQPAYDLGHESARLLLSRLGGYTGAARTVVLPTSLNIRASSAPAVADRSPGTSGGGPRTQSVGATRGGAGKRFLHHHKIVTVGEILAEVVAQEQGTGFREPLAFVGPFPSGAPAIFIDQVARLGQACAIIGCVGDDDFGWVNLERLTRDGVDVAAIEVLPGHATGSAFVRYREDGGRDFLFNTKDSACGQISLTKAGLALLDECSHVHISGASLFSNRVIDVVSEAVTLVKRNGGSVSFDPNVRKEVMGDREVFAALKTILSTCDTFLPSGDELTVLTDATTPDEAVREILALGVSEIVVKQGADGAAHYSREGRVERPAYLVQEVDPTGAGDCFDAAFITCRLQGRGVEESLDYANAAGARAVTVRGPMEGTSDFAQLDAVRSARRSTVGARPRIAGWLLRGPGAAPPASPPCARHSRWCSRRRCSRLRPEAPRC